MSDSEVSNWVIYGLCLTDDPKVRYVGYTTVGTNQRLRSHFKDMNRRDYPLYRWMKKHGKSKIRIRVLESCPEDDHAYMDYSEKYWINSLRGLGLDLFNIEYGGRGGRRRKFKDSTRVKLSEASKRGWETNPDRFKGKPKSEAWKAAASLRFTGENNPQFGIKKHRDDHSIDNIDESCKHCMKGKF